MNERIIDISGEGASLSAEGGLLVIQKKEGEKLSVPFDQVGVVILAHPMIRITGAALSRIVMNKGMVIVCESYLPVAMLLPIGTHSTASRNYTLQAMAKTVLKKHLWAEIVRAKVRFQSDLLDRLGRPNPLKRLVSLVRSGDTTNVEGHAARLYWEALFGEDFVRDRERQDVNRFLNYGYIVLRSCVARALCSSGLHPSFGIYHHNQYNAYCLVDDMMEPFRPLVDEIVWWLWKSDLGEAELSPTIKKELVKVLQKRVLLDGRWYELFDALSLVSSSLLLSYEKGEMFLRLPEKIFEE